MRFLSFALLSAVVSVPALAQSNTSEVQALQSLVNEVHQLREELRTVTVASQRVQIVLYRLQAQEAAVLRASQQLSDARGRLAGVQERMTDISAEIKMLEDRQSRSDNPAQHKEFDDALSTMRPRLEGFRKEEQQQEEAVSEAESQLHNQQRELDSLRGFLDQLDKVLEGIASSSSQH
jgi:chromosome segregation ATPase